ncbi:imelysin family protein [uncultured Psychromonas sp.]|uniref:imelysin family protein n=1 Tax=uncultured Psychromonas sp. TaxID=173974 RepID=UPI002624B8DF|nr:imelysin family protein [uncultured Psychromonas sp.]
MKKTMLSTMIAGALLVSACNSEPEKPVVPETAAPAVEAVAKTEAVTATTGLSNADKLATLSTYANIASANYSDAVTDAKTLQTAISAFVAEPTEATLQAAKDAWLVSRESYGTTEIFRLSNGPIDAEDGWVAETYGGVEGELNSWPLDENMIDYTIDANNERTTGNIIDTVGLFTPGGEDVTAVDVTTLTPEVLGELNTNGGDANVAAGYHAIEFMLWGQDQDYNNMIEDTISNGAMTAGQRPLTDFTIDKLAKRRLAYLGSVAEKMVDDLSVVASAWEDKVSGDKGLYRAALLEQLTGDQASKNIELSTALKQIFAGVGVFSKSELANERIAVAVLTPSEEDEHSCFSDNTHRDIALNYQGIKNVLLGEYKGEKVGPAFIDNLSTEEQAEIATLMADIETRIATINTLATTTMHFDYQIRPENEESVQNIVTLKNQLRRLGDQMVTVSKAYGISLTTNDVTDAEETQL